MEAIGALEPDTSAWLWKVTGLSITLDGQIEHEEAAIWPRIRAAWGDAKLAEAGRQVDAARAIADGGASIDEAVQQAAAAR
jgi:hypothetical protein